MAVAVLGGAALTVRGQAGRLVWQAATWLRGGPAVSGGFDLVDAQGRRVTDRDFRGRLMLIYFGYTYSPDTDPATLQAMSAALELLGPWASRVVPIFITVDPDRDDPVTIGQYTALFDPRLIGLTGQKSQTEAVEAAFDVYSKKLTFKGDIGFIFDHSSYVYLMGPDGKLRALFKSGTNAAEMARVISASLSRNG